jgi:hypothetical protein
MEQEIWDVTVPLCPTHTRKNYPKYEPGLLHYTVTNDKTTRHGLKEEEIDVISGFRRDVKNEICVILGLYAEQCGNSVPTFRENLSVPS